MNFFWHYIGKNEDAGELFKSIKFSFSDVCEGRHDGRVMFFGFLSLAAVMNLKGTGRALLPSLLPFYKATFYDNLLRVFPSQILLYW